MATRNENGLTDRWQVFADAYRADPELNAAAAYRKAYPKASQRTCEVNGAELLKKTEVRAYLSQKMQEAIWNADVSQERILKELMCVAFSDIRQLFNDDGTLKSPSKLSEEVARAIGSIEVVKRIEEGADLESVEERTHKIKTNDKLRALDMLGKYLDMWKGDKSNNQLGVLAIPVPSDMTIDEWQQKYYPEQYEQQR